MSVLLRSLTQHSEEMMAILIIAIAIVGLLSLRNTFVIRKIQAKWSSLLQGGQGQSLETLLYDHLREKMRLEADLMSARKRIEELEEKMATTKRHLGLVRHDAFEDVGGNQSFALALFDDHGNGTVLSGIVGRTDARVYCKPLVNGRSERNLSQEEQRAIREAKSVAPKTIVSPQ